MPAAEAKCVHLTGAGRRDGVVCAVDIQLGTGAVLGEDGSMVVSHIRGSCPERTGVERVVIAGTQHPYFLPFACGSRANYQVVARQGHSLEHLNDSHLGRPSGYIGSEGRCLHEVIDTVKRHTRSPVRTRSAGRRGECSVGCQDSRASPRLPRFDIANVELRSVPRMRPTDQTVDSRLRVRYRHRTELLNVESERGLIVGRADTLRHDTPPSGIRRRMHPAVVVNVRGERIDLQPTEINRQSRRVRHLQPRHPPVTRTAINLHYLFSDRHRKIPVRKGLQGGTVNLVARLHYLLKNQTTIGISVLRMSLLTPRAHSATLSSHRVRASAPHPIRMRRLSVAPTVSTQTKP